MKTNAKTRIIRACVVTLLALIPVKGISQPGERFFAPIRIGIHCDPLISWMNTNTTANSSEGVRPGFDFGVNFYKYFAPNYAFSTGIGFMTAGGRQSSSELTSILFNSFSTPVLPGKEVVYKLKYLSVPFGLKLQTNQIGYLTFFTDIGFDARVILSSRIDIPSENIENESGQKEVKPVNFGWHFTCGGEYSLGGSTAITVGMGFDDNFFDVTKDNPKANQEEDRSLLKFLRFRLGVIF